MLGGFALATLFLNTPAAIVVFFVYKWVLPGLFALGSAAMAWFDDLSPWLDFQQAQVPVSDLTMSGSDWGHLIVSGFIWLVLPAGDRPLAGVPGRGEVTVAGPARVGAMTTRADGRADDELRPITITRNWLDHAAGSVLVEFGRTRVLCAASASEGVPALAQGHRAWAGSPRSTPCCPAPPTPAPTASRSRARIGGRTHEISRLIGRSLRAVIDYKALGENTIVLDCDVLQADGGTRTAAITGAYVALADAVDPPAGRRRARRASR